MKWLKAHWRLVAVAAALLAATAFLAGWRLAAFGAAGGLAVWRTAARRDEQRYREAARPGRDELADYRKAAAHADAKPREMSDEELARELSRGARPCAPTEKRKP